MQQALRIEVQRRARRAHGTLSLAGTRLEIPSRLRHLRVVHLRYARWDLSQVDLVDARSGAILGPIRPLDKAANANGQRRRLTPAGADLSPLPPSGMAPLLRELLAEYAATGLPPAYLSTDEPAPTPPPPPPPPPPSPPTSTPPNDSTEHTE